MIRQRSLLCLVFVVCISLSVVQASEPVRRLVATEGKGYLETVDGYPVLHLKGTPDEMGYQHGVLLKQDIQTNVAFLLTQGLPEDLAFGGIKLTQEKMAQLLVATFKQHVPERYMQEMQALARGADLPEWKVVGTNLIPEFMHCSGFALLAETTAEGKLLHGRVLDYGVKLRLQEHAVLTIQEPDGRIPFANVSYSGFIGSVTGMNLAQISIGEMGGGGVGQWNGMPMSFLMRMVLEDADSLDKALGVFQNNARTCEYYYVIADAQANSAVGLRAVPEALEIIKPGQTHRLLPTPVANTVLMSAGTRYTNLTRLVAAGIGTFTQASAIRLMDAPVAMTSNLHNALMVPKDGIIHIANADKDTRPAWQQRYYRFDIRQLIKERPKVD